MVKCTNCSGTGLIHKHKKCENPLTCPDVTRCTACNGTGKTPILKNEPRIRDFRKK